MKSVRFRRCVAVLLSGVILSGSIPAIPSHAAAPLQPTPLSAWFTTQTLSLPLTTGHRQILPEEASIGGLALGMGTIQTPPRLLFVHYYKRYLEALTLGDEAKILGSWMAMNYLAIGPLVIQEGRRHLRPWIANVVDAAQSGRPLEELQESFANQVDYYKHRYLREHQAEVFVDGHFRKPTAQDLEVLAQLYDRMTDAVWGAVALCYPTLQGTRELLKPIIDGLLDRANDVHRSHNNRHFMESDGVPLGMGRKAKSDGPYQVGEAVSHAKYGAGLVVACTNDPQRGMTVEVNFASFGKHKFILSIMPPDTLRAPLQTPLPDVTPERPNLERKLRLKKKPIPKPKSEALFWPPVIKAPKMGVERAPKTKNWDRIFERCAVTAKRISERLAATAVRRWERAQSTLKPARDRSLFPEMVNAISDTGAIRRVSLPRRQAVEKALSQLEAANKNLLREAAENVFRSRDDLTGRDLFRLVQIMGQGSVRDLAALDTLVMALQRPWEGIEEDLLDRYHFHLETAAREGRIPGNRLAGLLRPLWLSTPTTMHDFEADSADPQERLYRYRQAVRAVQARQNRTWISLSDFIAELGVSYDVMDRFLRRQSISLASLSIIGQTYSDQQLFAVLATMRQKPGKIVFIEDLVGVLGKDRSSLADWAGRQMGKPAAVYLAQQFRVFWRYGLDGRSPEAPDLVPYIEAGLDEFMQEQGTALRVDLSRPPDNKEMAAVLILLEGQAKASGKPISAFTLGDIRAHPARLSDRALSLATFYTRFDAVNDTGYETLAVIRMHYGHQRVFSPLREIATLAEFKEVLQANILMNDPYKDVGAPLQAAIVQELAEQKKKPLLWLSWPDYNGGTKLKRLGEAQGKFNLRNFYLYFDKRNPSSENRTTPIFILKTLQLVRNQPSIRHPVQLLKHSDELREALRNRWLKDIPWQYLPFTMLNQFIKEVAKQVNRTPQNITARHMESEGIPSLTYRDPKTKVSVLPKLRGLFALFSRTAPSGVPKLTFLRQEIERGLKAERGGKRFICQAT